MKIYNQMMSATTKGKLKDKNSLVERKGLKFTDKQAKYFNDLYKHSPRFYIIDEEATKNLLKKDKK